jgi:hypothetical protein
MRIWKRCALILAGCAIAAVVAERVLVLTEQGASVRLAEKSDRDPCAPFGPPAYPGDAPSVPQPGGLDPLGVSRAIHRVLEECP